MKKWEYKIVSVKNIKDIEQLNASGEIGWEMVSMVYVPEIAMYRFAFKREK